MPPLTDGGGTTFRVASAAGCEADLAASAPRQTVIAPRSDREQFLLFAEGRGHRNEMRRDHTVPVGQYPCHTVDPVSPTRSGSPITQAVFRLLGRPPEG